MILDSAELNIIQGVMKYLNGAYNVEAGIDFTVVIKTDEGDLIGYIECNEFGTHVLKVIA